MISDTTPAARAVLTALYRKAGQEKCAMMALQMSADYRAITLSGIRARRPDATEAQVRRELARLVLGAELADRAYGPELP
jgi:hypothetical protein